ncbi:MAG: FecCD family ABC transporter permease [Candidatus Cyclobacteriaceae bacterium M3_2C_046]
MNPSSQISFFRQAQQKKWLKVFSLLFMLLLLFFLVNVSLGSVTIPIDEIIKIMAGISPEKAAWSQIFWQFRFPKAITAVMVGIGLSISGLQMQTLFRNPLAGPFVLGISSGASLGVAIVVMASFSLGGFISTLGNAGSWLIVIAATLGASSVLLLVVIVSIRIKDSMTLLIVGLMFGSATGAVVSVLQYFSNARDIQAFLIWTFGNLGGITNEEMKIFLPVVFSGMFIAFLLAKPLNALLMGENYAQSMGLNLKSSRLWIIISTSLLAGVITAFCGPIAFIGIAVPHLTRILFNTSDHRLLIPLVSLSGAIVVLFSDVIAQVPGSQHTLPINAITSIIGAPVIIWIILRRRNIRTSFTG